MKQCVFRLFSELNSKSVTSCHMQLHREQGYYSLLKLVLTKIKTQIKYWPKGIEKTWKTGKLKL